MDNDINSTIINGNNMKLVNLKQSKCKCSPNIKILKCESGDDYLRKSNYLGEFETDKEKEIARDNLGISTAIRNEVKELMKDVEVKANDSIILDFTDLQSYKNRLEVYNILKDEKPVQYFVKYNNDTIDCEVTFKNNKYIIIFFALDENREYLYTISYDSDFNFVNTDKKYIQYK